MCSAGGGSEVSVGGGSEVSVWRCVVWGEVVR